MPGGWLGEMQMALRTVHSAHLYSCWSAHDDATRRRGARRLGPRVYRVDRCGFDPSRIFDEEIFG